MISTLTIINELLYRVMKKYDSIFWELNLHLEIIEEFIDNWFGNESF